MSLRTLRSARCPRAVLAVAALAAFASAATQAAHDGGERLIGQPAPDFALPAVVGSNVRLSEYRGQAVILSFWSSRCGVCARELNLLDRLYKTYQSAGLVVLAISVDDDPDRAAHYAREHVADYPLLLDSNKAAGRAYDIDRLPSTIMIDRSGIVRFRHSDELARDKTYLTQIRALLDDSFATP
ncbi:MAG TPA: peroxiredoxin family protein [Steroidobacteraceae bacterium]|jgi:peroxiredoxin